VGLSGRPGRLAAASAILLLVLAVASGLRLAVPASAAGGDGRIVVALDLAHGESDKYVNYIVGNLSNVADFVLIENTTITPELLGNVDVLILGQPDAELSGDELQAIINWLQSGHRILWVAGDSDYPPGTRRQKIANEVLEAVGSHLRLEMGAVYDAVHNAGAFYRVLGRVAPDNKPEYNTSIISQGITKPVLYHGPTVLLWVDDQGNYHDLAKEAPDNVIRIVWTYNTSYIADNEKPPLNYYDPAIDKNRTFVMLAAEVMDDDIIVASGESPYGDYEPTWSWEYHNVSLDGPRFVSNMILWFKWWIDHGGKPIELTTTTTTQTTTTTKTSTSTGAAPSPTSTAPAGAGAAGTTSTTSKGSNAALITAIVVIIIIIIAAAALALRK
jgi:hypothetical protein